MKSAKILNLLAVGVLLVTFAAGCKKQPKNITTIPGQPVRPGGDQLGQPIDGGMRVGEGAVDPRSLRGGGELPEPIAGEPNRAILAAHTVYFDFDRSAIRPSEQSKLDAVATYLKNTPGVQLVVEGHCDERGTEEYNRSLGERRAIAAREYLLQRHGIGSHRITTASFGEDRPADLGKTEEAYARNRRAEFVVLVPE